MYKELKQKEREKFDPEYIPFDVTSEMAENFCIYIPKLKLDARIVEKPNVFISFATKTDSLEDEHKLDDFFHGRSTSTYPYMEYKKQREGEPVCDQYRVNLCPNNSIIAVADGCNWGRAPATAASKASKAFIDYMNKNRDLFVNTYRVARLCLEGLAAAHNSIIAGPYEEGQRIGTTTLLGGLISKVILPGNEDLPVETINDWVFVFASIGDCKAFLWQSKHKRIEELTPDSRNENFLDASDCGGRVGPYIEGGPDIRNLQVFMAPCFTGDTIIVCSDGVHDNFDPQMHGLQPKDLNVDREQWEDCTPSQANAAKAEWRVNEMKRVVGTETPNVEEITTKFVEYCCKMNEPAQKFMQENLGKKLPNDYTLFPGKMDHTTMVTLRVGEIPDAIILQHKQNSIFPCNDKPKLTSSKTEQSLGIIKKDNSNENKTLLRSVYANSCYPKNKFLRKQNSDYSCMNQVRRTKSETTRKAISIKPENPTKRCSTSIITNFTQSDFPEEIVSQVSELFREITRHLREINVSLFGYINQNLDDPSESKVESEIDKIRFIMEQISNCTDKLLASLKVIDFTENIKSIEKALFSFISFLNVSDLFYFFLL